MRGEEKTQINYLDETNISSSLAKCGLDMDETRLEHLNVRFRKGLTEEQTSQLVESLAAYGKEKKLSVQFRYFSK